LTWLQAVQEEHSEIIKGHSKQLNEMESKQKWVFSVAVIGAISSISIPLYRSFSSM